MCLTGLFYQTTMLFLEYLSGQTVVTIKIGNPPMEKLPAITLCSINYFIHKKLAQIDPEMQELYENYTRILDEFGKSNIRKPEYIYIILLKENLNLLSVNCGLK